MLSPPVLWKVGATTSSSSGLLFHIKLVLYGGAKSNVMPHMGKAAPFAVDNIVIPWMPKAPRIMHK